MLFRSRGTTYTLSYDASDNLTRLAVSDCASCGGDQDRIFTYTSGYGDPLLNGNLSEIKNADLVVRASYNYSSLDQATKGTVGADTGQFGYDTSAGRVTKQFGPIHRYSLHLGFLAKNNHGENTFFVHLASTASC